MCPVGYLPCNPNGLKENSTVFSVSCYRENEEKTKNCPIRELSWTQGIDRIDKYANDFMGSGDTIPALFYARNSYVTPVSQVRLTHS